MMYKFNIKNDKTDIELALLRAILSVAAVASYVYPNDKYPLISYVVSILLIVVAIFMKRIIAKLKMDKIYLVLIAALLLFIVSGQIGLPIIMLCYGFLLKLNKKEGYIAVNEIGVLIKTPFSFKTYYWEEFNHVVLKDGLLSLDLKTNKIRYISIDDNIDEIEFNTYCDGQLKNLKNP
ncbi:MAG: hypothetical protein KA319_14645 [Ferruginibacter sp.]|nr:hypothetical protein [Ferruginibacter sp.]